MTDHPSGHAVYLGELRVGHELGSITNISNFSSGELRGVTMLENHIPCIVSVTAKEKMLGADTQLNIALVADKSLGWDFAEMQSPRYPVSLIDQVLPDGETSITASHSPSPKPTAIGPVDVFPKSFCRWDDRSLV